MYASWKNTLPSVYWEESLARLRGKYLVELVTSGQDAVRSKAEYGKDILTWFGAVVPKLKMTLGF